MGIRMLQLQPIAVRLLVVLLLVAALGIAASAYLGSVGRAQDQTATMNVRAAAAVAEAWLQDPFGGDGSYRKLDARGLVQESPSVSPKVHVTVLANGAAYCLDDEESAGHSAYYIGGDVSRLTHVGAAVTLAATLVRSRTTDAAAVCRSVS